MAAYQVDEASRLTVELFSCTGSRQWQVVRHIGSIHTPLTDAVVGLPMRVDLDTRLVWIGEISNVLAIVALSWC